MILYDKVAGKILATNRRGSIEIGLPGGKVDEGETPIQAATRELREETGISLARFQLQEYFVDDVPGEEDYQTHCYIRMSNSSFLPVPGGKEEGIYAFWVPVKDLVDPKKSPFFKYNIKAFESFGIFL